MRKHAFGCYLLKSYYGRAKDCQTCKISRPRQLKCGFFKKSFHYECTSSHQILVGATANSPNYDDWKCSTDKSSKIFNSNLQNWNFINNFTLLSIHVRFSEQIFCLFPSFMQHSHFLGFRTDQHILFPSFSLFTSLLELKIVGYYVNFL